MDGTKNRGATFRSVIVYLDESIPEPISFEGESRGEITLRERKPQGEAAFGFDPIFQPEGTGKSFAEMPIEEKNRYSHRAKAMRKFVEWHRKRT